MAMGGKPTMLRKIAFGPNDPEKTLAMAVALRSNRILFGTDKQQRPSPITLLVAYPLRSGVPL